MINKNFIKKIDYKILLEGFLIVTVVYLLILRAELHRINSNNLVYKVENTSLHSVGKYNADCLDITKGEIGNVAFGPFVKLEPGEYVAIYKIKIIGDISQDNFGKVDVVRTENGIPLVIASSDIYIKNNENFKILYFSVPEKYNGSYEFRTFSNGLGSFSYCGSKIQKISF